MPVVRRPGRGGGRFTGGTGTANTNHEDPAKCHTVDEAASAGIEVEERGERFAVGAKAERSYTKAVALYERGAELDPTSGVCLYNGARVYYLLATDFHLPPKSIETLRKSLQLYERASATVAPLPDAFALDVSYNAATALQSLAELNDELALCAPEEIVAQLGRAAQMFTQVADAQEQLLLESAAAIAQDEAEVNANGVEEGDASSNDVEMDTDAADESGATDDEANAWTASPVTPASTLETLLSLHTCALSLISHASGQAIAGVTLDSATSLAASAIARADALILQHPRAEELSDEGEWAAGLKELDMARQSGSIAEAWRRAELADAAGVGWPSNEAEEATLKTLEDSSLAAGNALLIADAPASEDDNKVKRLSDVADLLVSLSTIRLFGTPRVARAWELASLATKLFLAALSLLDARRAGALGAQDVSTPSGRARSSLGASLSSTSLLRAGPASPTSLTAAQRTTLLDNARVYARRSVEAAGLKAALGTSAEEARKESLALAPLGGWQGARTAADALLAAVRASWARALNAREANDATRGEEAATEMKVLAASAWGLLHGANAQAWQAAMALDTSGPRRITDEGWAVNALEAEWWTRWMDVVKADKLVKMTL